MAKSQSAKQIRCPYREKQCPKSGRCISKVVGLVKDRRVIFSDEIRKELRNLGWGKAAAIRALSFLHHVERNKEGNLKDIFGCDMHIEAFCKSEERVTVNQSKVIHFRLPTDHKPDKNSHQPTFATKTHPDQAVDLSTSQKNVLFYDKSEFRLAWDTVRKLMTPIQSHLLASFEDKVFGSYYLSSYEVRKLNPFPADRVSDSLDRLLDLGFLREKTFDISKIHKRPPRIPDISEIVPALKQPADVGRKMLREILESPSEYLLSFFATPKMKKNLSDSIRSAAIEEQIEHEVVRQNYLRLLRKNDRFIARNTQARRLCTMRVQNPEMAKFTKGYCFDSFYKFLNNSRLGVDVFVRLILSEAAVRRFSGKIGAVGCSGMICACKCASRNIETLCRDCGIQLIPLKKTTIDLPKIRQDIETRFANAGL